MGAGASSVSTLTLDLAWSLFPEEDGYFPFASAPQYWKTPLHRSRILCYGDSLTAGFYAYGQKFSPYGAALQEALCSLGFQCEVSICGLSGHSAHRMVEELDSPLCRDMCGKPGKGLAHILDENGPFDLVVLMAGTNDFVPNANLKSIKNEVCKLHDACHIRNVPTVMLAAPCNTQKMQLGLRRILSNWASSQPEVLAFVDPELVIPRNKVAYWEPDSVHFSPSGSRALGIHLAPAIAKILRHLGQQPVARASSPQVQPNLTSGSKFQQSLNPQSHQWMAHPTASNRIFPSSGGA